VENMNSIVSTILFIVIFLLFAIKRQYVEILVMLIIMLIMDFVIVKGFETTPFLGAIVISIGKPFIDILVYAIVKLIVMGIFYFLTQKNYIVAFIGYLIINVLINAFYMTISGNIFIDIIFNALIAGIILTIYNKFDYLDDLKWFSIGAMVIDFILEISISSIFFK